MAEASSTLVPPGPDVKKHRLVVTGHDSNGQSVFLSDQVAPHVQTIMQLPNFAMTDLWKVFDLPADNSQTTAADPCSIPAMVAPPPGGCVFRVVQFAPDKDWAAIAAAMGGAVPVDESAKSASKGGPIRHAHMHRTRSIDFAIVLSGEIWAVMDVGEKKLVAGDILVQRGTNHAWANRSDLPCIMAFILIDAKPLD